MTINKEKKSNSFEDVRKNIFLYTVGGNVN
jgi:hypothetical protein